MCVSVGNGAVAGNNLGIRLIDGSGLKLINPAALHTYRAWLSDTRALTHRKGTNTHSATVKGYNEMYIVWPGSMTVIKTIYHKCV